MGEDRYDEDLTAWEQFVTAVGVLAAGRRLGLTVAEAHREALEGWTAEQAALFNRDEPFVAR